MPAYIDESRYRQSVHGGLRCTQCHTDISGYPHGKVRRVDCGSCHLTGALGAPEKQARNYSLSVHAKAAEAGVGPICQTCHGSHYILPSDNPRSRTFRANIPKLCSRCHYPEYSIYIHSIHGTELLEKGDLNAATCYDCHEEHAVPNVNEPRWMLWLIKECGNCHREKLETYRDTYHGQVTNLGYTTVAKCPDCHGYHDILPPTSPQSSVSAENILKTCRKCHPYADRNFTEYYPHPEEHDRAAYPVLFYTYWFMTILLVSVFSFFILHTIMWALRTLGERNRGKGNGRA
jgi:hypothetical protein